MKVKGALKKLGSLTMAASVLFGTAVTMPVILTETGMVAYAQQTYGDFSYEVNDGTVTITRYRGNSTVVSVPSVIDGKTVTAIGNYAFDNAQAVTKVTLPGTITSIGNHAFSFCKKLKSVTIPNGVASIGNLAFYGCESMTSISLPASLTAIGDDAFYQCNSLTGFSVASANPSFTAVDGILYNKSLTTLLTCPMKKQSAQSIPVQIKYIKNFAFWGCSDLKTVTIPEKVVNIGEFAFFQCTSLTSLTIPDSVTGIQRAAFASCTALKTVRLPNNIPKLDEMAFAGCSELEDAALPDSLMTIEAMAFYMCKNLNPVTIPQRMYKIQDGAFFGCDRITSVSIPKNVSTIGQYAFGYTSVDMNSPEKIPGFVVYGQKGSQAETYAKSNEFTFIEQGDPSVAVTKVKLYKTKMTLGAGEVYTMQATILPGQAGNKMLVWSSTDSNVVSVTNGVITARSAGTATITARSSNGLTAACKITVKKAPSKVTLAEKTLTLGLGETYVFKPQLPNGCASEGNIYRSDNNSVIRGTKGEQFAQFKALKLGTANVSVTTYNGQSASCRVVVKKAPTWVQLSKKELTLKVGDRATLTAKMAKDTGCSAYTFRSDDPTVAQMISTTGSGVFRAVRPGVTNVTVTLFNGKQASCRVTVVE